MHTARQLHKAQDGQPYHAIAGCLVILTLIILTLGRLAMSVTLHMWFAANQRADDGLLMSYSMSDYPSTHDPYKLAKNQGYGFFLRVVSWSKVNIDIVYFGVWLLAAVLTACALYSFFHIVWLSLISYCYVLWNPLAFENWLGTRLYRNSLIPPSLFILIALLMLYLTSGQHPRVKRKSRTSQLPWKSITATVLQVSGRVIFYLLLGLVFAFVYDLKEDSAWLIPMFLFVVGIKLVQVIQQTRVQVWKKCLTLLLTLLPLVSAAGCLQAVRLYNDHNFGVALLNTRTQGAMAGFTSRVYQVASPHQSPRIWATADALDAVERVSPTLRSQPTIMDYIRHRDFAAPSIYTHPIEGDFLTWQLIGATDSSLGMDDEGRVQSFYQKVNKEIDTAFEKGDLIRSRKIRLSSSLPGRTPQQITSLIGPSADMLADTITLGRYYEHSKGKNVFENSKKPIPNKKDLQQLNIDAHDPNPQVLPWFTSQQAKTVAQVDVVLYRIINICLCLVFLYNVFWAAKRLVHRQWRDTVAVGLSLALIAYAFIYAFAVSWFIEYTANLYFQFFFTVGSITPLVIVALLLAAGSLVRKQQIESSKQCKHTQTLSQPKHKRQAGF